MRRLLLIAWLACLCAGVYFSQRAIETNRAKEARQQPLYLPNGNMLHVLSLGYDSAMASVLWVYSIQYAMEEFWGDKKYVWLYHVYDLITDLDPQFQAAYVQGSIFLGMMQGKPEKALQLLDKAKRENPDTYVYPAEQSFYAALHLKDLRQAVAYLAEAEKKKDAPLDIKMRMTGYYRKLGQDGLAFSYWFEQEIKSSDPRMREVARKMIQNQLEFEQPRQPERTLERWRQVAGATQDPEFLKLAREKIAQIESLPPPTPSPAPGG